MLPNKDKPQMSASDPAAEALTRAAMRRAFDESAMADICECQGRNPAGGPCQKCTEEDAEKRPRVLVLGGGINTEVRRALNAVFRVQTLVRAPAITREEAAERQRVAERAAWNSAVTRKKWTGK